jgi:uncharacterized protein
MKQVILKGLALIIAGNFYINANSQSLSYDVVPIESKIYNQPYKIFVYTAQGKLPATSALPVFYLTNIQEKDNLFYQNLNKMVEEGSMPPMLIVGIHKQISSPSLITAENSYDPKKVFTDFRSDDDNYFSFIEKEVVPAIEKKYNCSKYKILSSHETAFTNYILKNHPSAFNAYVFEKPFIWVDNTQLTKLKPGTSTINIVSADIYFPEEYYLKYGKKAAWHQE